MLNVKNLLKNNGVSLEQQVADYRIKRAGVIIGKDLNLPPFHFKKKDKFPLSLIKRLAGY